MKDAEIIQETTEKIKRLAPGTGDDILAKKAVLDVFLEYRAKACEMIPVALLCDLFGEEMEHQQIVLERFLGKWGNLRVEPMAKICLIVRHLKPQRIFEMGTYTGATTLQMALNSPPTTKIFTLDLPPDNAHTKHELSKLDKLVADRFGGQTETGCYFQGHRLSKKIEQLWGDTATFDYTPYHGTVDLVFIDAAHDYENKKSDTENALKILRPGGVIIWDNYLDSVNPYVTKYLYEFSLDHKVYALMNTNLAIYKS